MKLWRTLLLSVCAASMVSLSACEKDEVQAKLTPSITPTLTASTNTVVLRQANSAQTAVTYTWQPVAFNWEKADNPYATTTQYMLEVDKQGNNFAKPATIDAGTGTSKAVTVDALNAGLNALGLPNGTAASVEVRLRAYIAPNSGAYSPAVALTATPYQVCLPPNSDRWSIIGTAGVDWNTDVPLTYNCDTRTYNLTRAFNAGAFKFRKNADWGVNYGSNTARNANGTAPLTFNGNDITVTTAGTYTLSLDLNAMTYTLRQ